MADAVARRIAGAIPLLLIISVGVFGLIHVIPGGPLAVYLSSPGVRPEDLERLRTSGGVAIGPRQNGAKREAKQENNKSHIRHLLQS